VPRINEAFLNLKASYLFAEIKRRTEAFAAARPDARVISLGIGDVTRPLPDAVVQALAAAAREQGRAGTLKGYDPYTGYEWLRRDIAAHDFGERGVTLEVDEVFDFYMENARIIRDGLRAAGFQVYGGENAPYIWVKTPPGLGSWDLFDRLLTEAHVVGTPGVGFGPSGEGYFRFTAFGRRDQTEDAVERIRTRLRR
jgi:aspartate/methionine/tyrosine aminotransferase